MTTANGEMDLDYFLEPDATYMGMKMNAGVPFFRVIDDDANTTFYVYGKWWQQSGNGNFY